MRLVSLLVNGFLRERGKEKKMGILRDIGAPGLIIIILGALLIFGPKRLPELGESVGKMLAEFKKAVKGIGEQEEK